MAIPSDPDVLTLATRIQQRDHMTKAIADRQREIANLNTQLAAVNTEIDARRAAITAGQDFAASQPAQQTGA